MVFESFLAKTVVFESLTYKVIKLILLFALCFTFYLPLVSLLISSLYIKFQSKIIDK